MASAGTDGSNRRPYPLQGAVRWFRYARQVIVNALWSWGDVALSGRTASLDFAFFMRGYYQSVHFNLVAVFAFRLAERSNSRSYNRCGVFHERSRGSFFRPHAGGSRL